MSVELPPDVIAAVEANHKIEAIKLLREHSNENKGGLGLKEAKAIIDAYIAEHPQLSSGSSKTEGSGFGRIILTGIIAALFYGIYDYFFAAT